MERSIDRQLDLVETGKHDKVSEMLAIQWVRRVRPASLQGVQSLKQEVHSLATAIGVALGSCRRLICGYVGTHHMHGKSDGHEVQ